jgi:hypothetical protein
VVTERVVDVLESIQIDAEDGERGAIALCQGKLAQYNLAKQTPIGQTRKPIVVRKVLELCVELFHLFAHHQGGVVGSSPVEVGLIISLADHIEESSEVDLAAFAGNPRKLVS